MIQPITNVTEALAVMHAAFARYKTDAQPSSALEETIETFEQELAKGIHIFGAYEEGALVGIVKCKLTDAFGYFSRLSVLPNKQGRGIAKSLIAYCEQFTKDNGRDNMQCKVRKSEIANIALYERLGYVIIDEEVIYNTNGDAVSAVTMEKQL
ncbi:GNAT family N-acetyltransferase [Caryophanon latum]|nr:GNAT family N-acetyltransferase [Caryophanon latum]